MGKTSKEYDLEFKLKVVKAYEETEKTQQEICQEFSVPRATLNGWLRKYRERGADGLVNKTTTPRNPARKTADKIIEQVVELKQQDEHKFKGLKSFADYLKRFQGIFLSPTTLSKIFKHKGVPLGEENYLEQRATVNPKKQEELEKEVLDLVEVNERFERPAPNDLWQTDITQFYIKDEGKVYLISFLDDHSRFVVGSELFREATTDNVLQVLEKAIDKYGAPKELLSDNGRQYVSWQGTTQFQIYLDKLNIKHIRAKPHNPKTLGKLERWHRSFKTELVDVKFFHSLAEAREEISQYIQYYNYQRTHSALNGLVPADRFFQVAKEIEAQIKNIHENPQGFYLVGNLMGKSLRIQEEKGKIEIYWADKLVQSFNFGT